MHKNAVPDGGGWRQRIPIVPIVAIWTLGMAVVAVRAGIRHDYVYYVAQWRLALGGADPWSTDNAYGPLHTVLAALLRLGPLAPKIAMVGSMLAANLALAIAIARVRATPIVAAHYAVAILANMVVIAIGVVYGLNDSLVAALIVAAIWSRLHAAPVWTGVLLGLAVLLKYYPLLLILFFALDGRRFNGRLLVAAATTIAAGLAAASALYGEEWLAAIRFGGSREPKMLSILSALGSAPWLVGGTDRLDWLIRHNAVCVLAGAGACLAACWWRRTPWLEASVLGLLASLLVYKVGHPQFFLPWLFLVAALPLIGTASADRLALSCWPFALFLSAFQWGYTFGSDEYHAILGGVRQYAGFVAFPLGLATIASYFWPRGSDGSRAEAPTAARPRP